MIGDFVSEANATTRISAPSSSRMFDGMTLAMNDVTSSGTGIFSLSAFLRRIASRVSKSGGLNVGEQTPLEPRAQPRLERLNLFRRTIATR